MGEATEPLTYDRLVRARAELARRIKADGEKYWPLFQRLDQACREHTQRAELLEEALSSPDVCLPPLGRQPRHQVVGER
jgi:hypothetical protein